MTLNGQFALKSGPSSSSMGWRSGFRRKLFGNLQSYAYTVSGKKCSPTRDCTGGVRVMRVMELFNAISEQEASNQWTVFTHSFHSCCSLMLEENNWNKRITMLELGCRQTMTGMETKRARGKCITNALVCQLCWTFLCFMQRSSQASKQYVCTPFCASKPWQKVGCCICFCFAAYNDFMPDHGGFFVDLFSFLLPTKSYFLMKSYDDLGVLVLVVYLKPLRNCSPLI